MNEHIEEGSDAQKMERVDVNVRERRTRTIQVRTTNFRYGTSDGPPFYIYDGDEGTFADLVAEDIYENDEYDSGTTYVLYDGVEVWFDYSCIYDDTETDEGEQEVDDYSSEYTEAENVPRSGVTPGQESIPGMDKGCPACRQALAEHRTVTGEADPCTARHRSEVRPSCAYADSYHEPTDTDAMLEELEALS